MYARVRKCDSVYIVRVSVRVGAWFAPKSMLMCSHVCNSSSAGARNAVRHALVQYLIENVAHHDRNQQ